MKSKIKYLSLSLALITAIALAAPIDKFDTITTNAPSKLKVDFLKGINFTSTDSVKIPVGSTAQRDASPATGMLRINSSTTNIEAYLSAAWRNLLTFTTNLSVPVEMDMNSNKIVNLTDPTSNQDAATKKYVDDEVAAIDLSAYVDLSNNQTVGGVKTFSSTIVGSINGNAATVTTIPSLSGEVSNSGNSVTLSNSAVIGKTITGFTSGAGALAGTDTILQAIQKLDGNIAGAGSGTITGPIAVSGGVSTITAQTGTGTTFVVDTSPTLVTPNIGVATATSVNGSTIPTSKTLVVTTDKLNVLAATSSSELAGVISDETGTGSVVYSNSPTLVTPALGTPSALVGTNITGTAAGLTAGSVTTIPNLTGEVTSSGLSTTVTNAAVIAKTLTGYTSGAGTVSSSDSIVSAIGKLNGNAAAIAGDYVSKTATETVGGVKTFSSTIVGSVNGNAATVTTNANLTGAVTSSGNATSLGSFASADLSGALTNETGTGSAVFSASPSLSGNPVLADASATSLVIGGAINANAVLDVQSTTKAFMPPRMTSIQMFAIASPTKGMVVYNTDVNAIASYSGTNWVYGLGVLNGDHTYSAQISSIGVVTGENVDWINGSCAISGNRKTCTYNNLGLTSPMNCVAVDMTAGIIADYQLGYTAGNTTTAFAFDGAASAQPVSVFCQKTGADYAASSGSAFTSANANYSRRAYTPTFTGFGTVSNVDCYESRNGEFNDIDCKFTAGTTTAVEARVSLPTGLTSTASPASIAMTGEAAFSAAVANQFIMLREPSTAYLTFGVQNGSNAGLSKFNGNTLMSSGQTMSFKARVPIAGWVNPPTTVILNTPNLLTPIASTSGTSIDFAIPNGAKRATVMFNGVSGNGTSSFQVQLASAGSVSTSGYVSGAGSRTGEITSTTGLLFTAVQAANSFSGIMNLSLSNISTNLWTSSGTSSRDADGLGGMLGGYKSLSGTLDRIRITTVNGTDTFDAGSVNVSWE